MTTVVINSVDLGPQGFADPGEIPEGKNSTSRKETKRLSERGSQSALQTKFSVSHCWECVLPGSIPPGICHISDQLINKTLFSFNTKIK